MGCELLSNHTTALIAGGFGVLGVCVGFLVDYWIDRWRQWEIIQAVKQAFYQELNTFWGQLSEEVEDFWIEYEETKETGGYFDYFSRFPPDYFTIYRSNANYLGQIDDSELRAKIIKVYMLLQALMQAYGTNTEFLREYIEVRDRYEKKKLNLKLWWARGAWKELLRT